MQMYLHRASKASPKASTPTPVAMSASPLATTPSPTSSLDGTPSPASTPTVVGAVAKSPGQKTPDQVLENAIVEVKDTDQKLQKASFETRTQETRRTTKIRSLEKTPISHAGHLKV